MPLNGSNVPGLIGTGWAVGGENYAATQAANIISGYDLYDRDYYKQIVGKVPKADSLKWLRVMDGYMKKRQAARFSYYFIEEGQYFNAATVIAAAVDNTTNMTLTLSPGDHMNGGTSSFPVVGQTVLFENEVVGYVTAVNRSVNSAHTVTVFPVDTTNYNLVAAAQVGSTMVFYSNAQQEESSSTETRTPNFTRVTNVIQTFRDAYKVTDHAKANQTEFTWQGMNFIHPKGIDEMMQRFALQEDFGLLVNPSSSGLVNAGARAITLAKGLIPQINDNGNTLEYFGTPDMTTWDDAILILNRSFGESDYIVGQGLNFNLGAKNWLVDFQQNADKGISFSAFDNEKQAINLNFDSISMSGYTFHQQVWAALSHSDSLGAGNMPYKDMAIFIPMGKTKNPAPDSGPMTQEPYLQLVYADPGAGAGKGTSLMSRGDYALINDGALAPGGSTNDQMYWRIGAISYKGLEVRCRNKFLVARKAA